MDSGIEGLPERINCLHLQFALKFTRFRGKMSGDLTNMLTSYLSVVSVFGHLHLSYILKLWETISGVS